MSRRVCVQCAETTMSRTANKHPFRVNIRLLVVTSVRVRRVLRTYLGISSIMHAAMCVRLDAESIYRILYITNNISKYPVGWARSRVNDQAETDTGFSVLLLRSVEVKLMYTRVLWENRTSSSMW